MIRILLISLLPISMLSSSAMACTGVSIGTMDRVVVGQNIGWFKPLDAGLVVNKRGVSKFGLTPSAADTSAKWTSLYGSITLNPIGREFPLSGVNEKGLTVQGLHSYDGRYETTSPLPVLNMLQWIQYQLDVSATVEEAVANAKLVRPYDNPLLTLHFMVCEASGRCAMFEWLNGAPMVVQVTDIDSSDEMVRVFTNSDYLTSVRTYESCKTYACPLPDDKPNYSLKRFVQAARLAAAYDDMSDSQRYMFNLLDVVKQPKPLASWSVVISNSLFEDYTPISLSVSAPGDRAIQFAELREFDLSCGTPAQMLILDLTKSGNAKASFKNYDINMQKTLVAGAQVDEAVKKVLSEYPDKTICTAP